MELSLLFPGAGQLREHKYLKGAIFIASEFFCIFGAIVNNRKGNHNYIRYREAITEKDAVYFRENVEKYDKNRNIFILAGIGVWIANMIDIYFYVKKKRVKLRINHEKNQKISFGFSVSF